MLLSERWRWSLEDRFGHWRTGLVTGGQRQSVEASQRLVSGVEASQMSSSRSAPDRPRTAQSAPNVLEFCSRSEPGHASGQFWRLQLSTRMRQIQHGRLLSFPIFSVLFFPPVVVWSSRIASTCSSNRVAPVALVRSSRGKPRRRHNSIELSGRVCCQISVCDGQNGLCECAVQRVRQS